MEDENVIPPKESEYPPLLISFLTEFGGTAILMWMGCMGCLEVFGIGPVVPAFAFGLAVTSAIQTFSHISPIHINPAVSTGLLILGKIKPATFGIYLLGQYTGALAGFALLLAVMPWNEKQLCLLRLGRYMNPAKGFFIEFGATMILMFVVAGATHVKNRPYVDSLSLKLGMVIAGLVFACEPFTGAGLNPARSLAPALIFNDWEDFWLYELAPFVGMALAAVLYRFVFDGYEKHSLHSFIRQHCSWCYL